MLVVNNDRLLSDLTMLWRLSLATALLQNFVIALKVASLDMREVKVWVLSSVETATAFGIILAVFSFVINTTDFRGICIYRNVM